MNARSALLSLTDDTCHAAAVPSASRIAAAQVVLPRALYSRVDGEWISGRFGRQLPGIDRRRLFNRHLNAKGPPSGGPFFCLRGPVPCRAAQPQRPGIGPGLQSPRPRSPPPPMPMVTQALVPGTGMVPGGHFGTDTHLPLTAIWPRLHFVT